MNIWSKPRKHFWIPRRKTSENFFSNLWGNLPIFPKGTLGRICNRIFEECLKKKHGRILFRIFKEKSLKCCLRVSGDIFEGIPDGVFKGIRGRILREFMNAFCKNPWKNIRKNLREVSEGILEWVAEEIYGGISGKNHWETLCKFTIRID